MIMSSSIAMLIIMSILHFPSILHAVPEDLTPSVICSNNDSGVKPFFGYEERKDQSVQSEPDSDLSQPFDCHTPSTPQNVESESSDDVGKVPRAPPVLSGFASLQLIQQKL